MFVSKNPTPLSSSHSTLNTKANLYIDYKIWDSGNQNPKSNSDSSDPPVPLIHDDLIIPMRQCDISNEVSQMYGEFICMEPPKVGMVVN
ncbi:hypothetical protein M8C21_008360, partial [Ambrosia artemisiifolia]